jgi:hypothetical protein
MTANKTVKKASVDKELKLAEVKLEKKKKELIEIKTLHKKVAREFIDLWMVTKRIKRQESSK